MALTLTNDILKFRESTSDPWEKLLVQANMNFNLIYPVGSIYMSTVNVNPATLFGGTWEQLEDRFLLGAGTTYTAGDTGGEATHTLVKAELPAEQYRVGQDMSALGVQETWYLTYANGPAPQANAGAKIHNTATGAWAMTEPLGSGQAHNNMPPYLVVYMWRRLTLSPTIYTPPANVLIGEVASEDIVPIAKGGTGANNAAGAIANLGFDSGTSYCKLPDGTLMEWGTTTVTSGGTSGYVSPISLFRVYLQFPIPFVSTDYNIFGSGVYSTGGATPIGQVRGSETTTTCQIHWWDAAPRTFSESVPLVIKWCAIGKWK